MSRVGAAGRGFREEERDFHWRRCKTITSFAEKGEEAISLQVQKPELDSLFEIQYRPGGSVRKIGW